MARTFSRNSQVYPAGSYGPFGIDSFTKDDADRIEVELAVEGWPDVPVVAVITITSDIGKTMVVNVPGRPKNRDGSDMTIFRCRMGIPADAQVDAQGNLSNIVKRNMTSASIGVVVNQPLRTAITLRAV